MGDNLLSKAEALSKMTITGGNFAYRYLDIAAIARELLAEVKRLQEDNAAKDDYLAHRLMTLNMHHNNLKAAMQQVTKLDGELARWREIAIRERSFNLDETRQVPYVAGENDLDRRERAKQMAAKELDLRISQEDDYLIRLENGYLSWVYEYYRDLGEVRAIKEARDVLSKIRAGGQP
jgi:hypothetical protein